MQKEYEQYDVDPGQEMDKDFKDVDPGVEMDGTESANQANSRKQFIIEKYKNEEEMMVLIFSQWCVNNDFDPLVLYEEAYPTQGKNDVLLHAIEQTVAKEESDEIPHELLYQVLQSFGNDDLVFVINEKMQQQAKRE